LTLEVDHLHDWRTKRSQQPRLAGAAETSKYHQGAPVEHLLHLVYEVRANCLVAAEYLGHVGIADELDRQLAAQTTTPAGDRGRSARGDLAPRLDTLWQRGSRDLVTQCPGGVLTGKGPRIVNLGRGVDLVAVAPRLEVVQLQRLRTFLLPSIGTTEISSAANAPSYPNLTQAPVVFALGLLRRWVSTRIQGSHGIN